MPLRRVRIPALVHHRPTGRARVRVGGRDIYLGRFGTSESVEKYRKLVADLLTSGTSLPSEPAVAAASAQGLSVNELLLAYWRFAEGYYRKDGKPTSEQHLLRVVMRHLREEFGTTPAGDFGPLRLKLLREVMIGKGMARSSVNQQIGRAKRIFRWAVENELVPAPVYQALAAVAGLRKGRTVAREPTPVLPVSKATIDATLPHLNRQVGAMVRLQALTGMRPGEVCRLRPCEVDTSGKVWEYRPGSHKTDHHGHARVVYIGPKGQRVLAPWLTGRAADAHCFSPAEAKAERHVAMRKARKTRVQPSQRNRAKRNPKRQPGDRYATASYANAIERACLKAGIEPWAPNRIRHTRATAVRKQFGLEAAQVTLGHSKANTTEVYAERDAELARRVASEMG